MSLLEELRQKTKQAHERLDGGLGGTDVVKDSKRYGAFLRASYRAAAPLEEAVARILARDPVRTLALREDLRDLGDTHEAITPLDASWVRDAPSAWGVAYVLEGSTLGGVVLARSAIGPSRYLNLRGERTGSEWRAFVETLNAWGGHAAADAREAACTAAARAFDLYSTAFGDAGLV